MTAANLNEKELPEPRIEAIRILGLFIWNVGAFFIWPVVQPIIIGLEIWNKDGYRGIGNDDIAQFVLSGAGAVVWIAGLICLLIDMPPFIAESLLAIYSVGYFVQVYLWRAQADIRWIVPHLVWFILAPVMLVGSLLPEHRLTRAERFDLTMATGIALAFGIAVLSYISRRQWEITWPLITAIMFFSYGTLLTVMVWEENCRRSN